MRRPHLALAGDGLLAGPAITPSSVTPLANNMKKSQGFFSWARHQDLWKNAPAPIMMIGYRPGLYSAAVKAWDGASWLTRLAVLCHRRSNGWEQQTGDRKSVVEGKSVSVGVKLGGRWSI